MKRFACSLVVFMAMLFFSTSSSADPLPVPLDSKNKSYEATLSGDDISELAGESPVALSTVDKAILTLFMGVGSKPATAQIYINGDEVEHKWVVTESPWTGDVSKYLQDGEGLTYEIQRKTGDFVFFGADLNFQSGPPEPMANPIPPTALLFGCALVGLAGIRWKFKR